jgi:ferric-dicitrate binding protein FerR (iron transport regulator)
MAKTTGVIALLLLLACGFVFSADKASIIYLEGDVTLDGMPASVGDAVAAGATLRTAADALCEVVFNARNIVHMTGGTILRFDPNQLSRGATLEKGAIAMVLRNLSAVKGSDIRFSVKTSTTVAGVRGTCFFVKVEDDNNTFICCCNGAIHLEGDGGAFAQNLRSSHHQEIRVTRAQSGLSVGAAPMLYHTDEDVEAIAARIGEKIDWTKVDQQP